jgi:chaperone required for assembly of F1-ATPase
MKRFYKDVRVQETPLGFAIFLDRKQMKTPLKNSVLAPNLKLAGEIEREWAEQGEYILPGTMPLTQILSTRIDRVAAARGNMAGDLLKYLDTDLICYRAERPVALAEKQEQSWNPWLAWFETIFGERLKTTTDLKALLQPEGARIKAERFVQELNNDAFTLLQLVTSLSGSLVLGMAFIQKAINAEAVFNAAHVEELYKAGLYGEETYGPDPVQEKKDKAMLSDLQAAEKYLALLA